VRAALCLMLENQSGIVAAKQPSSGDILDRRYARGEISKDEYERIKADLM